MSKFQNYSTRRLADIHLNRKRILAFWRHKIFAKITASIILKMKHCGMQLRGNACNIPQWTFQLVSTALADFSQRADFSHKKKSNASQNSAPSLKTTICRRQCRHFGPALDYFFSSQFHCQVIDLVSPVLGCVTLATRIIKWTAGRVPGIVLAGIPASSISWLRWLRGPNRDSALVIPQLNDGRQWHGAKPNKQTKKSTLFQCQ